MVDVTLIQNFYASALGKKLSADLTELLRTWPRATKNDLIAAIGYGFPYLAALSSKPDQCLVLMPAQMGAVLDHAYPQCLVHPHLLPLADGALHGILMAHLLEHSIDPRAELREAWRILQDDGDLMIIVPYRQGLWARRANQPFGYGTPYNRGQLQSLLSRAGFTITTAKRMIYYPPSHSIGTQKLFHLLSPVIARLLPVLAGILVIRARKSLLQPMPIGRTQTIPTLTKALKPRLNKTSI